MLGTNIFISILVVGCVYSAVAEESASAPSKRVCRSLISYHTIVSSLNSLELPKKCGLLTKVKATCCPKLSGSNSAFVKGYRVSDEKCMEYSSAVFKNVATLFAQNETSTEPSLTIPVNLCRQKLQEYSNSTKKNSYRGNTNGITRAGTAEFPHMAQLGYNSGDGKVHFICSGTLISEQFVLTTAHCTKIEGFGNPKFVRLGLFALGNKVGKDDLKYYAVAETLQYFTFLPSFSHYDNIALLKLQQTVDFGLHIRPACLSTDVVGDDSKVIASSFIRNSRNPTASLSKITLDALSGEECSEYYQEEDSLPSGIRNESQLCARSSLETEEQCAVMPGGVLQVFHPNQYCMYSVVAINSYTSNCYSNYSTSLYTKIYPYLDWIEGIVWGDLSLEN